MKPATPNTPPVAKITLPKNPKARTDLTVTDNRGATNTATATINVK